MLQSDAQTAALAREQEVVAPQLLDITRRAGPPPAAGGPQDDLGIRNRAVELAAMAETIVAVVDPRSAQWSLDVYRRARGDN
jgi:hypothetical protein